MLSLMFFISAAVPTVCIHSEKLTKSIGFYKFYNYFLFVVHHDGEYLIF